MSPCPQASIPVPPSKLPPGGSRKRASSGASAPTLSWRRCSRTTLLCFLLKPCKRLVNLIITLLPQAPFGAWGISNRYTPKTTSPRSTLAQTPVPHTVLVHIDPVGLARLQVGQVIRPSRSIRLIGIPGASSTILPPYRHQATLNGVGSSNY